MWRVKPGAEGRFVADDPRLASFPVRLEAMSGMASEEIELPYLLSTHGGPIAVNMNDKGKAIPTLSQHGVLLRPEADADGTQLAQVTRGVVKLDAQGESMMTKISRQVLRVLARESGL